MLHSTKTTKHTSSFIQASSLFGGNRMANDCQVNVSKSLRLSDYQVIKPSSDIRNKKTERVKEIKCVFV
jgi:hypothetical protein